MTPRSIEYQAPVVHSWLRTISLAPVPTSPSSLLLDEVQAALLDEFQKAGHEVQEYPDQRTDALLTTAPFMEPISWREAVMFTARPRFGLRHSPTTFTIVHARRDSFEHVLQHLEEASKGPARREAYDFPGLAPDAHWVLHSQNRRGGPIMALIRLVQAQCKSIRIVLVVGNGEPEFAYYFDLAGAHPRRDFGDGFYHDMMLRVLTAVSTDEVTEHASGGEPIDRNTWSRLTTPSAMISASEELGRRDFFTDPVEISRLVKVPVANDAIASQYSEGCFATWDPELHALVATITGSARPIHKGHITEAELAVIGGVRPDGRGAVVRKVEGKENLPPSAESLEMAGIDLRLPRISLGDHWGLEGKVPVIRSKLHGHRGVASYDPTLVEHVPLDPPYYLYPVSCASAAQADAVMDCFARSNALADPSDPRRLVFTVLPGHGLIIAEKWIDGKVPLQSMWEAFDAGVIEIDSRVPQGPHQYVSDDGRAVLRE